MAFTETTHYSQCGVSQTHTFDITEYKRNGVVSQTKFEKNCKIKIKKNCKRQFCYVKRVNNFKFSVIM